MRFQDVRFEEAARVAARRMREATGDKKDAYLLAIERLVDAQEKMDGDADPAMLRIEQNAFIRAAMGR